MTLEDQLKSNVQEVIKTLYSADIEKSNIKIDKTPPEFEGEMTVVIFPFSKISKKSPDITANEIGTALLKHGDSISKFNVIKGFLNISFSDNHWLNVLKDVSSLKNYHTHELTGKKIVVEYCGPNTNKPLHLGHVRNMLIGFSVANILEAAGNEVHKVNIYNDRGIAICKSMVAYLRKGNSSSPEAEGMKGDHFVGKYYVEYQKMLDREVSELIQQAKTKDEAEKSSPIYLEAVEMLRKWEGGDEQVLALWNKMNNWVYEGLNETYRKIGVDFEKDYFESEHFTKGRSIVLDGLQKGVFSKKDDGSVWVDLTSDGLDEKVLLRSDGTSVYITQDIGVAHQRYIDFKMNTSIYVVANEQDYHFKVLKHVLKKLGEPYADGIYHLSYGMVDLPEGKMKSREGTVVDADDLIDEMIKEAGDFLGNSDKIFGFSEDEKNNVSRQIGLGALKYFILKVDPKKRILFNPQESIDLHGHTGPFIQYTYARIQSLLRKAGDITAEITGNELNAEEKEIIVQLYHYSGIIKTAAEAYSPAEIANYIYHLAKLFNRFYSNYSILKAESEEKLQLRLTLTKVVGRVLKDGLILLGIETPERM